MPLPFNHISLAGKMAERYPHIATGDFFLGNIAPDAVLAHPACTEQEKFRTHLRGERARWLGDVMASLAASDKSLFSLGYHMHLLTDIFFRDNCRSGYNAAGIPEEEHDKLAYRAASRGIHAMYGTEISREQYEAWLALAKTYTVRDFPFGLTSAEMDGELAFAGNLAQFPNLPAEENAPVDFADIYHRALPYLDGIFGKYFERSET